MTSSYKEDEYVLCPFYCKESPIEVKCLGIYGTHTITVFRSKREKNDHKYDFCCGNYAACVYYQTLEEQG